MHVWRERLERWFTPLARRCPLSPNAITIVALLLNIGAASCFAAGGRWPALFIAGMCVVVVAGLADAFDGIVARVQAKSSRFGDFLDHFADRVSDILLISGWVVGNGVRLPLALAAVIAVMLNGYLGTQIEATWGTRSYDAVGRGEFVLALIVFPIVSFILFSNGWSNAGGAGLTIAEWMTIALGVAAVLAIGQRLAMARRMDR